MMNKSLQRLKLRLTHSPWLALATLAGVTLIAIGTVFYFYFLHSLINTVINKKISINEKSEAFEKWKDIPMPIYYRYYFFNVTNAAEIEKSGVKPIVKEVGPFTYRSRWKKKPVIFHDNGTVSYREKKTMTFVRSMSAQSDLLRNLVTINGPLTVTLGLLQRAPLVVRNIVSLGLSTVTEGFFIKRSAKELLFDGYPEMLTSFGPMLNPNIPNTRGRFAWLFDRNNTDDGLFTVFTGVDDFNRINQIDRYNGQRVLKYWKTHSSCNDLDGSTDGQIIAPMATPEGENEQVKEFILFHPEICRKIRFVSDPNFNSSEVRLSRYRGEDEAENEQPLEFQVERFSPEPNFLSSGEDYPPNECYTSKITPSRPELGDLLLNIRADRNQSQRFAIRPFVSAKGGQLHFRSGVFDLSNCKFGAPVLLSYPHFLHAHPNYRENLVGLRPDPERHNFYMLVEPRTGTSLHSRARVQINVYISKPPWISRFRYIPEIVFPVFWQELAADVPSEIVSHIGWALTKPFQMADYFSLFLIALGLGLLAQATWMLIRSPGKAEQAMEAVMKFDKNQFSNETSNGTDGVLPSHFDMATINDAHLVDQRSGYVNNGYMQDELKDGPARLSISSVTTLPRP